MFIAFSSAQKKFSEAELLDIQNELDAKIENTPANRIINADEMGMTTNSSKTSGYCRTNEKIFKKVPDPRQRVTIWKPFTHEENHN